jgi:hypothetical protein
VPPHRIIWCIFTPNCSYIHSNLRYPPVS